jgi:hypothetical protein
MLEAVDHVNQSISVHYVGLEAFAAQQPPHQLLTPAVVEPYITSTTTSAPTNVARQLTQIWDQSWHQRAILGATSSTHTSVPSITVDRRVVYLL